MSLAPTFAYAEDTHVFQINVFPGGQSGTYAYNYVPTYDSTQWKVVDWRLAVSANQSFNMVAGTVVLRNTASYANDTEQGEDDWGVLDAAATKNYILHPFTTLSYSGSGPMNIQFNYTVPSTVVATNPAICFITASAEIVFEALVPSPTNTPSASLTAKVTDSGNKPPSIFDFFTTPTGIVVGVIGAGLLFLALSSPAGESSTTIITAGFNRAKRAIRRKIT